jgi:hypothetical protein
MDSSRHFIKRVSTSDILVKWGMMDSARRVIKRILNPRVLS